MFVRDIRLCLLGIPSFQVDGQQVKIEPRLAFECLSHIIVAGDIGISRIQLAKKMWGHLKDEKGRSTQLRQSLSDLRRQLRELNISEAFELDGPLLRCSNLIKVDFLEFQFRTDITTAELELLLQPLAKGWEPSQPRRDDLWQESRDQVAEILAKLFEAKYQHQGKFKDLMKQSEEGWFANLKRAASLYPTNRRLQSMLVWELKRLNFDVQVEEAVYRFENEWIDRFGGEIPKIDQWNPLVAKGGDDIEPIEALIPTVHKLKGIVAPIALVTVALAILGVKSLVRPRVEPMQIIQSTQNEIKTQLGSFRVAEFNTNLAVRSIQTFSDGSILCSGEHPFYFEVKDGNFQKHVGTQRNDLVEKFGSNEVLSEGKSGSEAMISSGVKKYVIKPTEKFPVFGNFTFRPDGSLIYVRSSDDVDRSWHRLCLFKGGEERVLDNGLGPVRVSVPTFVTNRVIYAKYSQGTPDKWRYTSFTYDTLTNKTEVLNVPPVVGKMADDTLVCMPEITTENEGNYYTRWDGTVKLCPVGKPPVPLQYKGQTRFFGCWSLGDIIILAIYDNPFNEGFVAVDRNGNEVPELSKILKDADNVFTTTRGVALFMKQPNRYMLLESAP